MTRVIAVRGLVALALLGSGARAMGFTTVSNLTVNPPQSAKAVSSPAGSTIVGDAARGGMLFLQCRACHTMREGDEHQLGPNLWGVVGTRAGSRPGFGYSAALSASNIVWDRASLDRWLTHPAAVVPGTKMTFAGLASAKQREDIIAFLYTLRKAPQKKTGK